MARSEVYADYLYSVPAGESIVIAVGGEYVGCISSNQDDFLISLDGDALQFMAQGLKIRTKGGDRFANVTVDNSGNASTLTLRLAIGDGDLVDQRLSLTGAISVTKGDQFDTVPDVSVGAGVSAELLATDTARCEAIINNLAANAATLRVGDSNVAAARGVELAPGETIVLTTTEAVHAYNPGGVAQSVAVMEIKD